MPRAVIGNASERCNHHIVTLTLQALIRRKTGRFPPQAELFSAFWEKSWQKVWQLGENV